MDATTLSITLSAILAVICIPCGLFLGLVPMKADLVTAKQSKASQMVSFIVAIVFIGLLVAGHDLETWAMVIGLVIASPLPRSPHCTPGLCTSGRSSNPRKWLPTPKRVKKARKKVSSGLTYSLKAGYRHRYPAFSWRTYPLRHIAESYCRNTPQVGRPLSRTRHPRHESAHSTPFPTSTSVKRKSPASGRA